MQLLLSLVLELFPQQHLHERQFHSGRPAVTTFADSCRDKLQSSEIILGNCRGFQGFIWQTTFRICQGQGFEVRSLQGSTEEVQKNCSCLQSRGRTWLYCNSIRSNGTGVATVLISLPLWLPPRWLYSIHNRLPSMQADRHQLFSTLLAQKVPPHIFKLASHVKQGVSRSSQFSSPVSKLFKTG